MMDGILGSMPVTDPAGVLAILLAALALIFFLAGHPSTSGFFKIVPALVFCYFVPTLLSTVGIIPQESVLYDWIKAHVLPAALLLLIISLDLPGIIRLGPKAGIMLLAGTTGVVVGAPVALYVLQSIDATLPDEIWKGMAALCGSWIGGGANFVAMGQMVGTPDALIALMVIPDVLIGNIWTGVLFFLAGQQQRIDRWTGADSTAIDDLKHRIAEFEAQSRRIPTLNDLIIIVAIAFIGSWASGEIGHLIPVIRSADGTALVGTTTWKYIVITTIGLFLSFTPVRRLEGAGASRVGSVMLYLLVACIGAHADFAMIAEAPWLLALAAIWMVVHILVLLTIGLLIKAPIFFVAVGSQANIGGAASAPVVAAAFHPSLAPVGVLLAVAGYVMCTYAGQLCIWSLKIVAGVE